MKFNLKRSLKRMAIQTVAVGIAASTLWGLGSLEPSVYEKTRDTLYTSMDAKWAAKKVEGAAQWVRTWEVPFR